MANIPAARMLMVLTVVCVLGCLSSSANAQILPFGPLFPNDTKQCQAFSKDVDAYAAEYSAQHEKCLAENKPDRPDETHDTLVCSRSRCQYLHDYLYGDSILSVKSKQKEVAACYEKVREYQAEEARKAKEKADQEAQDKKDEAAEAARREQVRDARDAQDRKRAADRVARDKADKLAAEAAQKAESDRIAAQQIHENAPQSAGPVQQTPRTNPRSSQNSNVSSTLVDPFKDSGSTESQRQDVATNQSLVDPFAAKERLVDPFGASSAGAKPSSEPSDLEKARFEIASRAIEVSTKKAESILDQDIAHYKSQAGVTINRDTANRLIHEAEDTKSLMKTVSHLITGGQYALIVKSIASAESPGKREEAEGELVKQMTSDLLPKDLIKKGMTEVAPRLFGERVGLFLVGAAAFSVNVGAIVLDSTKTGRDPSEVIHDSSGKVSLSEKQSALMEMWKGYERHQGQTNNSSDEALKRQLWINSNIVYNQCLEAKSDCERWKDMLSHK